MLTRCQHFRRLASNDGIACCLKCIGSFMPGRLLSVFNDASRLQASTSKTHTKSLENLSSSVIGVSIPPPNKDFSKSMEELNEIAVSRLTPNAINRRIERVTTSKSLEFLNQEPPKLSTYTPPRGFRTSAISKLRSSKSRVTRAYKHIPPPPDFSDSNLLTTVPPPIDFRDKSSSISNIPPPPSFADDGAADKSEEKKPKTENKYISHLLVKLRPINEYQNPHSNQLAVPDTSKGNSLESRTSSQRVWSPNFWPKNNGFSDFKEGGDFSSSSYTTEFVSGSRIRTSGWLTSGNSTERSSVYSWGEDEFDKEASKNVAKMFEDIDAVLFEASRTNNAVLKTECKDWVERFPHIRIIGTQIFEPTDTGCRFYPTSSEEFDSRPSTSSTLIETDALLLSVTGYSVKVLSSVPSPDTIDEPPLEEVFFSDGVVEEVLAFDSQQQSTEIQTNSNSYYLPQRRRKGYPPITPFACVRDTSYAALFVRLWADILKWCSGYWHQQWHEIHPSSDIPSLQPQSRTTPYEHEFARSMQGSVSQQRLGTASSMASHNINGLNQLLSIGPKKITMRQPSNNLEDNPFPQSSTSSLLKSSRQQSRYPPLRSSVVRLQPLSRGTNGKKFAMLGGSYPPGGALQEEDLSREMVVRRLVPSTGNEQFSPPPYRSAHVSGVILPPIESGRPSRAFSAKVDDKFLMKPTRILIGGHFSTSFKENYDSRPSTTIDFRDEYGYPLRKLSNPRANIPQELSYGVVGIPMALNAREDSTLSEEHLRGDSNEPWVDAPRPGSRPPRGKLGTAR